MCHIIGIEPQFENIIKNGPFILMIAGERKPVNQWSGDKRKAANLDQRLKSLIMSVLPDDQMNFVINCLTAKSTWDDLILYHEGPSDVKESRIQALMNALVNDGIKLSKLEIYTGFINGLLKKWLSFCQSLRNTNIVKDSELAYLFGKLKYEENLIDSFYEIEKNKSLISATPLSTAFFSYSIVQDFQDSPNDEEDTRSSHEYLNDLEEEYQARALLAKSKRFFKKGTQRRVSSDDNEMVEVKVLMAQAEENDDVNKEGARNGEWFDEKRGTIFNSNKEVVMIALRLRDVYVLDMTSSAQESCFFAKASKNLNWLWHKRLAHLNFKTINKLVKQNLVIGLPSLVYSKDKPCSSCEKGKHHRASFKTKQTSSINKCLHLLYMDLFRPITPRSINHEKYTFVIVDEYSRYTWVYFLKKKSQAPETIMSFIKRVENQNDIKVKQLRTDNVYIHNHKDHLGKFNEKAEDGYLLGYSLVSKAFRVFNTRRQKTEETYHIIFDESLDAIKFLKPSVDDINIAETERYPPDEYLHPYEPSQRYQTNTNDVSFIEPYKYPKPVVLETEASSDQNGQNDHNDQDDQSAQNDEILNNDHSEHSNHTNDKQIIDTLLNTKDIQISKHLSSLSVEDTSVQNTIPIPTLPLPIPSMVTPDPQDRSSQDKHIELVNIIGNPGAGMLTRAMAKQLSNASAHVCLFVDFLSEEEPKKVSKALKHPGWVDAMQDTRTLTMLDATWTCASQLLGGKLVCWSAKKKQSVAMSSAKAEYVPIFYDNTSAIAISNNPVLHSRIKHIDIRYRLLEIIFVAFAGRLMMIKIIIICSAWHNTKPEPSSAFSNINLKTSSPEITPKEEHVTLDKPKSPTPFVPASQADFTFDEITFTTNNVVELLYPLHPKQDYFEVVSDFIYKCYLKEAFTRAPNQYKEYLSKVWYTAKTLDDSKVWISSPIGGVRGEIGITTFRNALRAQYLPHSSMYVSPPSITIVRPWFATIGYRGEIGSKGTLKKSCLPSRWRLLMAQIMHCLGGSNPSVLVDKIKSVGDGLKTSHTNSGANKESKVDDILLKVKLKDLSDILKDTRSAFFTLDSSPDEPIIVSDENEEEEEVAKDKNTKATSHDVPKDTLVPPLPSPKSAQIQELMAQLTELLVTSLKPELSKLLASYDFSSCLLTKLKEHLLKIIGLSGEIKELKKHVRDMEIELPGDLKEIPTKLETFTSTISSLSSQVTDTLNRFATMVENASGATGMNVPSAGIEVVEQYHIKKLLFDKYCEKMLKRRKSSKIINCDVLTQKGPISLIVYREDGLSEVIENLKVSDLHLPEWIEVFDSLKLLQRKLFKSLEDWEVSSLQFMQRYRN
ncbi:retrovirus-related pol polyprotein from transposon TNT 1-94 [Tanacetum coccineum]